MQQQQWATERSNKNYGKKQNEKSEYERAKEKAREREREEGKKTAAEKSRVLLVSKCQNSPINRPTISNQKNAINQNNLHSKCINSIYSSIHPSIRPSVRPSIQPSIYPSIQVHIVAISRY